MDFGPPIGWYVDSDNQIVVDQLAYALSKVFINNATVVGQLRDINGVDVGSEIIFVYQAASNGRYVGTFPASVNLGEGLFYLLTITITTIAGEVHTQRVRRKAFYDDRD
jgi:hypothetical protein